MSVRAVVELVLGGIALVAAGFSWAHTRSTIAVAPVVDGQPATLSVFYDPQQVVLALSLATVAGIFAVIGVARLSRARRVRPIS